MEKLDTDASKSLSLPEILNDTQNFLTSQVTHYGDVYKLKHLREHIFLIDNDTAYDFCKIVFSESFIR